MESRYNEAVTMQLEEVARISKALADPARLRIYHAIAAKSETFCGELVQLEGLSPGTISHHLKVLQEAGLIECRREGAFVFNRVRGDTMERYTVALAQMAGRG